jgi:uncharacterized protein (DUF2384 family)
MVTLDAPLFERNFEGLMEFLHDEKDVPTAISPKRYANVMKLDLNTLADQAHVHRNTINRAPATENIQRYMRETIRVLRAATDLSGSVERAIYWFKNNPIPTFRYKTAQELVSEGKTDALLRYIDSLQGGAAG